MRKGTVSVTGASLRHSWLVWYVMRGGIRGQAVVDRAMREAVRMLLLLSGLRRALVVWWERVVRALPDHPITRAVRGISWLRSHRLLDYRLLEVCVTHMRRVELRAPVMRAGSSVRHRRNWHRGHAITWNK